MEPALYALIGAVFGAGLTAAVAIVNTRRLIRKDEHLALLAQQDAHRQQLTERSATFVAATYHAVLSLRDLALANASDKPRIEKMEVWPTVDPVNRALSAIRINDPEEIVEAAEAIDEALVILSKEAHQRMFTHDEWSHRRGEVMADRPERAIAVARQHARAKA